MQTRSRRAVFFLLVSMLAIALTTAVTGCASLLAPRSVELPLARLQQAMQSKFPFNNRYLDLFDITVSNPRLSLQPDTNRITTALDARIEPPFLKKPWEGKLVLSGTLAIDMARNAIVLTEPRLENLTLDGATGTYTGKLARLGALLAEDVLNNMPVYTFKPDDLRLAGMRMVPTKITARANSLVVSFEPAK